MEAPLKSLTDALNLLGKKGSHWVQFEHAYDPYSNGEVNFERSAGDKIKNTRLNLDEIATLVKEIKKKNNVKGLDLSGQHIGAEELTYVVDLLDGTNIESLYLDDNKINDDDCEYLASHLKKNKSLKELSLSGNKISSKGASALAQSLKKNGTLESLWLNRNRIRDDGAIKFGRLLKSKNHTLTSLCMEENLVRESGAKKLAKALRKNDDLKTLNLGGNKIGRSGAKYFDKMIDQRGKKDMPEVELILDGNRFNQDDLETIKAKAGSRHVRLQGRTVYDDKPKDKMKKRVKNYLKYHWMKPKYAGHFDPEQEVEPVL